MKLGAGAKPLYQALNRVGAIGTLKTAHGTIGLMVALVQAPVGFDREDA